MLSIQKTNLVVFGYLLFVIVSLQGFPQAVPI